MNKKILLVVVFVLASMALAACGGAAPAESVAAAMNVVPATEVFSVDDVAYVTNGVNVFDSNDQTLAVSENQEVTVIEVICDESENTDVCFYTVTDGQHTFNVSASLLSSTAVASKSAVKPTSMGKSSESGKNNELRKGE